MPKKEMPAIKIDSPNGGASPDKSGLRNVAWAGGDAEDGTLSLPAPAGAVENGKKRQPKKSCCKSMCTEVQEFLNDWFKADDLVAGALASALCGNVGSSKEEAEDTSETPAPVVSPTNRKDLYNAKERFTKLPEITVLAEAFEMGEEHIERMTPLTREHSGWKMLLQQCRPLCNHISKEAGTPPDNLSFEQIKEFFGLAGQHFFNQDLSNLVTVDMCERYDFDGTHDLSFLEAFYCFKFAIERKLHQSGALEFKKVPFRTPEHAGYRKVKETSRGNNVSAYLADSESAFCKPAQDHRQVAIVVFAKKGKTNPRRINKLADDLEFCTRLEWHDNVGRIYEIFQDDKHIYSACEPNYGGDLTMLRRKAARQDVYLSLAYFRNIFRQCLEGVCHIHAHGVMHCDIKELSIIMRKPDVADPSIVIVDTGMLRCAVASSGPGGTPGYMPPEVYGEVAWFPKGDVFSLGVTFFQLLTDRVPDPRRGVLGIFQKGAKLQSFRQDIAKITMERPVPMHLIEQRYEGSPDLTWLHSMMERDRHQRPMSAQLLKHNWFTMSDEEFEEHSEKPGGPSGWLLDAGSDAAGAMLYSDVEGKAQEEVMLDSDIFPFFILAQTATAAVLWIITVFMEPPPGEEDTPWIEALGGLDRFWPGKTFLQLTENCVDYRYEVWRWITYQYTHVGIAHIGCNCLLNLLLGIPLEKLHGSFKAFLMYNIGVVGGALCYMVGDARNAVVGMSGGCYSLVGLHAAYTVINWKQRRYRKIVLLILVLIVAVDVVLYLIQKAGLEGATRKSNTAHLGGGMAGLCIGIVLGNNLKVARWEVFLKWFVLLSGIGLTVGCLFWGMMWAPAPITDPDFRYCWYRQVYNASLWKAGAQAYWRCVRCTDEACIATWSTQEWISTVTRDECDNTIGWGN